MFGMGFTELLLIAVVAIIFLGPDKLPQAMVEIARTIKKVKKLVATAKDSLEEELHLADIKDEALAYKKELTSAGNNLKSINPINNIKEDLYDVTVEESKPKPKPKPRTKKEPVKEKEEVTFKKKEKTPKEENE
ncbi:Sec-independent protein translocase protein TatB [Sulfurimonas sp. HSL-1716]|uniref:Sec-independent protein translocase protein TatB n=1 Tax=Hydrocurvibacter sulfurireducens TaxID=3131937 RepID=UPI0031F78DFF